jgi:ZIP family zinc transporter
MPDVLQALVYAAAPTAAIPAAAVLVAVRPPGPTLRSLLQHFAAGGLIAVIAVELLGDLDERSPLPVIVGIAAGTTLMTGLDVVSTALERRGGTLASAGFLTTVTVDFLIDGLLLGIALGHESGLGLLLAIVLTLEDLVTGLSVASAVGKDLGRSRLIPVVSLISLAFPVGAVGGALLGDLVSGAVQTAVLAFAAVALLFLVLEELLREAHEVEESHWGTSATFLGLLIFLLLEGMVG